MLVDDHGHPAYSLERVVPGQEFPLPIEAASKYRVRIQPDREFLQTTAVTVWFSDVYVQRVSVTNGALRFIGKT
jgi:vacuolar protein sorting-associated protein 13A/C